MASNPAETKSAPAQEPAVSEQAQACAPAPVQKAEGAAPAPAPKAAAQKAASAPKADVASKPAAPKAAWSKKKANEHVTDFKAEKTPRGLQVGAWVLWLVGCALEVFSILVLTGTFKDVWDMALWQRIVVALVTLVVDLVCVLVATRLWRKASQATARIKERRSSGPSLVGVIMACLAFVPMVLFFATSKNAGGKPLVGAIIAALVAVGALSALAVVL